MSRHRSKRRVTEAVAKAAGRRVFDFERPELWSDERNRLREERRYWVYALRYGPNDFNQLTDADLRAAFDDWGHEEGVWDPATGDPTGIWPETSWARQRYINGLSVEDARAAMAVAEERSRAAEQAAWHARDDDAEEA